MALLVQLVTQYPLTHTSPAGQGELAEQGSTHCPFTQACPEGQGHPGQPTGSQLLVMVLKTVQLGQNSGWTHWPVVWQHFPTRAFQL